MRTPRKPRSRGGQNGQRKPDGARGGNRSGANGGGPSNGMSSAQRIERYLALAREAEAAGDVVQSQYYYQYAEHYVRKENARSAPG